LGLLVLADQQHDRVDLLTGLAEWVR